MQLGGTRQVVDALIAGDALVSHGDLPGVRLGELARRAGQDAIAWRGDSWSRGDVMILAGMHGVPLLVAIFGLWSRNAVPLPLPWEVVPEIHPGLRIFALEAGQVRRLAPARSEHRLHDTAILHFTSGSTGTPNLVRRSAATLVAEARRYAVALDLRPDDRVLVPLPIFHSFGWGVVMASLMAGCHLDLRPRFSPRQVARSIDAGAATIVALTPAMAQLLTRCPGQCRGARPRAIFVGAGPVSDPLQDAFERRFGVGLGRNYGSTETGATFSGPAGLPAACIGTPMAGVAIKEPSPGGRGEMLLELTPAVDGYLGMEPSALWRTGDIVTRDTDDRVTVLGRVSDALRVNGRNLDRRRIHDALLHCSGVDDVYLLVRPRPQSPEVDDLWALVQTRTQDVAALFRHMRQALPGSHRPNRVRLCRALPRTAVGKIDNQKILRWLNEE